MKITIETTPVDWGKWRRRALNAVPLVMALVVVVWLVWVRVGQARAEAREEQRQRERAEESQRQAEELSRWTRAVTNSNSQ